MLKTIVRDVPRTYSYRYYQPAGLMRAMLRSCAPARHHSPRSGRVPKWLCTMATMPPKPFYERGDVILVLFPLLIYTPPHCVGL
jgi:hypothetical protein